MIDGLRKNSRLVKKLGSAGFLHLGGGLESFTRLLPHSMLSIWEEGEWRTPGASWEDTGRRSIRLRVSFGGEDVGRTLTASMLRLQPRPSVGRYLRTLNETEKALSDRIARQLSRIIRFTSGDANDASLAAIMSRFDEEVVGSHLQETLNLALDFSELFRALRQLAEQTYENKALTFGCIIERGRRRKKSGGGGPQETSFPRKFLQFKRYRALSDGFRTAYRVSADGKVIRFEELVRPGAKRASAHWYPEWAESIAVASMGAACALCLTRHGDLLVFVDGSLRFSYRFGRWQYWNHAHLVDVLREIARVQRVSPKKIGTVVRPLYRTALDIAFRRTGGLLVLLRNRASLHDLVRQGDAIGDKKRNPVHQQFDSALTAHTVQSAPRAVLAELAGLDGAVVLNNDGDVLAYGAILQATRRGRARESEGARTKAAVAASRYGMAIKISSDGGITVYSDGEKDLEI